MRMKDRGAGAISKFCDRLPAAVPVADYPGDFIRLGKCAAVAPGNFAIIIYAVFAYSRRRVADGTGRDDGCRRGRRRSDQRIPAGRFVATPVAIVLVACACSAFRATPSGRSAEADTDAQSLVTKYSARFLNVGVRAAGADRSGERWGYAECPCRRGEYQRCTDVEVSGVVALAVARSPLLRCALRGLCDVDSAATSACSRCSFGEPAAARLAPGRDGLRGVARAIGAVTDHDGEIGYVNAGGHRWCAGAGCSRERPARRAATVCARGRDEHPR